MRYEIRNSPDHAMIDCHLDEGESVVAESGVMASMSSNVRLKSEARGGAVAVAKRKLLGGGTIFRNTYTAEGGSGRVMLSPGSPGDIFACVLEAGRAMMIQSSACVAATPDVRLDGGWDGARGFFSGAGMILLRATGPGTVFVSTCGAIQPLRCDGGRIVDTDHVVAFQDTVEYRIDRVDGIGDRLMGGEGLAARFSGRGEIHVQTRGPSSLASFVHPFRPVKNRD